MTRLFERVAAVTIDELKVEGLRIAFSIERNLERTPNPGKVTIWNLSADSRAVIDLEDIAFQLDAGYVDNLESIFVGDVATVTHARNGASWQSTVTAADGRQPFRTARISRNFEPGVALEQVITDLAEAMGVGIGNAVEKARAGDVRAALTEFAQGFIARGAVPRAFDRLVKSIGLEWSIQDGRLQLLEPTETTAEEAVVLSADTGLLGSPQRTENGNIKARSLLQPFLTPGRQAEVRGEEIEGFFRVEKVRHIGDTDGPAWFSEFEGSPV